MVCGAWAAAGAGQRAARGVRRGARRGARPPGAHVDTGARGNPLPRQDAAGAVPRGAAPQPRLRGRRALGGLRPGATRGAGRRSAAGDRAVRRPIRGADAGARAGARAGHARDRRTRRWPQRSEPPSSCRRSGCAATASAPRRWWSPSGPRRCSARSPSRWSRPCCAEHRPLEGLRVRLQRVALRYRQAPRCQPRAQRRLAHQPPQRRGDRRPVGRVHQQRVLAVDGDVAGRSGAAPSRSAAGPPQRPRARSPRTARRCSRARARRPRGTAPAAPPARRSRAAAAARRAARPARSARRPAAPSRTAPARPRPSRSPPPRRPRSEATKFLSGTSRPTAEHAHRPSGPSGAAARRRPHPLEVGALDAHLDPLGRDPQATPAARRPCELKTTNPSTRDASRRCTKRCSADSIGSLQGVSSLMITSRRPWRRHQASARQVAGPYSELTTPPGPRRPRAARGRARPSAACARGGAAARRAAPRSRSRPAP